MKARKDARSTEQLSKTPALRTYGASGQRAEDSHSLLHECILHTQPARNE